MRKIINIMYFILLFFYTGSLDHFTWNDPLIIMSDRERGCIIVVAVVTFSDNLNSQYLIISLHSLAVAC